MKIEDLSVTELKNKLERIWHKHEKLCRAQMAPLLYHLRLKLKAQGKAGAGFGAWIENTLDISRRTADRWADEWAIDQGLKKPAKKLKKIFDPTIRQMTKSDDDKVVVTFQMTLTEGENKEWLHALRVLGPKAEKVVFNAVLAAAKKPAASATESDRKRLTFVDDGPGTVLGDLEKANAKGAGR